MRRSPRLCLTLVLLAGGLGSAACRRDAPKAAAPDLVPAGPWARGADVLLITVDTLRADSLGFAGNAKASTPLLDRLAAAGRVFTDAHAHNVVTLPSHTNLLTGLYPFQHGVRDNSGFVLDAKVPTLATLLSAAGYQTAAFVGAFPLDARFGLGRGFATYDDGYARGSNPAQFQMAERRGDQVVEPALRWWQSQKGKQRFLWVHLYDPHSPYAPPEPFAGRFRDQPYLGEIAATDSYLAPLVQPFLDGREPPALVIFTSDHGEALGEHGELTHGLFAYEATLKVPLVIWGPKIAPGSDTRPARHVDVLPTVLDALGVEPPQGLPGRSLLRAVPSEGGGDSYFEALTSNLNRGWAPLRGLIRERKKWIELPLPELYDLAVDAAESENLFPRERRLAAALRQKLPQESVWPPAKGTVSEEEAERLRSLGYITGDAGAKASYTEADDPKRLIAVDAKLQESNTAYSDGHFERAAALAREAIALRPDLSPAYENAALALRQLERHDEAIALLRSAIDRGIRPPTLLRNLALSLCEVGRPQEAVQLLQPLAAQAEPETLVTFGIALSDAGRPDEAVAALERAGAADADNPDVWENLGIAELRRGDAAKARAHLQKALQLNDNLPISWNTLGVALYQSGDPAAALAAWERSVLLDPRQYDALFNVGLVGAEIGRTAQARQALERFLSTAPRDRFGPDLEKARQRLRQLGG